MHDHALVPTNLLSILTLLVNLSIFISFFVLLYYLVWSFIERYMINSLDTSLKAANEKKEDAKNRPET